MVILYKKRLTNKYRIYEHRVKRSGYILITILLIPIFLILLFKEIEVKLLIAVFIFGLFVAIDNSSLLYHNTKSMLARKKIIECGDFWKGKPKYRVLIEM